MIRQVDFQIILIKQKKTLGHNIL